MVITREQENYVFQKFSIHLVFWSQGVTRPWPRSEILLRPEPRHLVDHMSTGLKKKVDGFTLHKFNYIMQINLNFWP